MRGLGLRTLALATVLCLAPAAPAAAELRINELDVFLNDYDVTVHAVALGTVPATFSESVQSGIVAFVRFTVELWQYHHLWRDRLLTTRAFERQLSYNVVTKEYRVAFTKGETRPVYTTRELRDAQRMLSEVRASHLAPAASLDPSDVIYVRVYAETALGGENTFITRMAGTAQQTMRQSDYRTIQRAQ
jgi:hypothetical protein